MANRTGTSSSDMLVGTTSSDTINGLGGDDIIAALDGDDTISGGSGNDNISGGNGIDTVYGNEDDDVIDGGAGSDNLDGGSGDDVIVASEGSDIVSGGVGNDWFVVHGSAGDQVIINDTSGFDTLDFSVGSTAATIDMRSGASSFVDGREIVINGGSVELPLDFVLLEDLSGSFSDDVSTLQSLAPDLVSGLQAIQPDVYFGVASFVDKPTSPFGVSGDYVYQTELALTASGSDFQTTINNLVVRDGLDLPEAQIEALMQLALRPAEIGFRSGTLRAVVIATDATPHVAGDFSGAPPNNGDAVLDGGGIGEDYPTVDQLRSALLSSGVVPVFAVTADVISAYQDLVEELGFGTVVALSTDSADIIEAVQEGLTSITTTDIEAAVGTDFADTITGNDLSNFIDGGAGADTMKGGLGDDTYFVDATSDKVVESGGQGLDTVYATASYSVAGQYVENLALLGAGDINGTGNSLSNTIGGNFGSNMLDGGGGADTMRGGFGNDTYIVDNVGDRVFEIGGEGLDSVLSSVTYSVAGQYIENLTLTGTDNINGTGNSVRNTITGNNGINILDGGGGADTLKGGLGNDTYIVDNVGDDVVEADGQGIDHVRTSVSYSLYGRYVEKLTLTGNDAIDGIGNSLANTLVGNDAANRLTGGGARDEMTGGGGADTFVLRALSDSEVGSGNRDYILDFTKAEFDKIDLSAIDAVAGTSTDQAFTYLDTGAFTNTAGELHRVTSGTNTIVEGDVNGDGAADFQIVLKGIVALQGTDFVL